jgi:protoporphyrinogen oxidase
MKGIIVGGGLSGLGAYLEMENKFDNITLIEKENDLMGVLSSFEIDGYKIPKFYHHLSDDMTFNFFKESGLGNRIAEKKVRFGFFIEKYNKFSDLSKLKLLFFKPFTLHDKIKFGTMGLKLIFTSDDIRRLDKISAEEWMNKNVTPHAARFFGDLIEGHKFPIPFSQVSAAWLYERFKLEIGRFKALGYPKGREGWDAIADYATKKVKGDIRIGTTIKKIVVENGYATRVVTDSDEIEINKSDLVVCSLPSTIIPKIVQGVPEDINKKFESIEYAANISLVIGIEEKLTDFYWINTIGNYPFGTIIDQNNLYGEFPWRVFYISTYCNKDDPQLKMSEEELFNYYMKYFERIFKNKKILWHRVFRTLYGGAIEKVGLFDMMPTNEEFKNLKFAGQYTTYPYERSTGRTVMSGRDAVRKFLNQVNRK